jgi:hypothetical protein
MTRILPQRFSLGDLFCHRATYVHAQDDFAKANVKVCNTNGPSTTVPARSAAEYHAQG